MSQTGRNLIATFHVIWILAVLLLPASPWYMVSPWMIGLAILGNVVFGECPLLLWEHGVWYKRDLPFRLQSMTRRMFGWIGLEFTEEQAGGLVIFLSIVSLVMSALRWTLG